MVEIDLKGMKENEDALKEALGYYIEALPYSDWDEKEIIEKCDEIIQQAVYREHYEKGNIKK